MVTAERLNKARASIQPDTGASTYTLNSAAIDLLPGGSNVSFNQLVLQMPGVAQDQFGQLHMRGDHANIQYRFDGVILPEGLSFFGQVVDTRVVDSVEMVTGALPAEYGLRTAGVLDITTKSGIQNGGEVGIYGGSHGEWEPSIEYGGTSGNNTYFGTASYMQNQLGIEFGRRQLDAAPRSHDAGERVRLFRSRHRRQQPGRLLRRHHQSDVPDPRPGRSAALVRVPGQRPDEFPEPGPEPEPARDGHLRRRQLSLHDRGLQRPGLALQPLLEPGLHP